MAVVYKAHDESLKREVAVKLLHPHLLAEAESKTRLEREAQAVAKLHHDNIVQIFDYSGSDAAASYIVTEFIDGQTLKQFIGNRKPPPPEVAAMIAIEIGNALLHAHSLGIIHRDVKPDNVMVRKDGMLKLMDFGVAQIMDLERMTVTGQLLGSPAYMAPEILEGRPLDVRTDVFSVGIMLYQLTTGSLPFSGRNPHEVLKRIAEGKFADPRTVNRLIADRLAKIIARALARRPDDRYPNVAALVEDLTRFNASAGLHEVREELSAYFKAPDQYEKTVVPRMIAALVAAGKREREARRNALALELWNRALAMDPSNREVLGELKQAASRQHLQRALVAVASAAVLAVGGFFVLRIAGEGGTGEAPGTTPRPGAAAITGSTAPAPAGSDKPTGAVSARDPQAAGQPQPGAGLANPVNQDGKEALPAAAHPAARPGARPNGRTGPALRPAVPSDPRTITIVPIPQSMHISVDGRSWGYWGPQKSTIDLDLSREHRLVFSNDDCCESQTLLLGPGRDLPENDRLLVTLKGKPAYLTVVTEPPEKGRVLLVETDAETGRTPIRSYGALGSPMPVSFYSDPNMTKTLQITVSVVGQSPKNQSVKLQAGARDTVSVKLAD
jgi:eukaryotic-like serine/threonine-protein kinase